MPPLLEGVNFKKIVTVLAVSFGIGLGLCGLNYAAVYALGRSGRAVTALIQGLIATAWLELLVMILSAVGLVITLAAWGLVAIINRDARDRSGP